MKRLEIEWRHLDKELKPKGWEFTLKETLLTEQEIPKSNSIFFNGIAIEKLLPDTRKSENCCASCGEVLGASTMCRTLERNGQNFEAIPAAMIVEAAHRCIETQTK